MISARVRSASRTRGVAVSDAMRSTLVILRPRVYELVRTQIGGDPMPRASIATVCLSGSLEDRLGAAGAAGFDAVEIFENDLLASTSSPEQIRARVADLGLTI